MKARLLVFLTVLALCLPVFAQAGSKVGTSDNASTSINRELVMVGNETIREGFAEHNVVSIIARHCDKYVRADGSVDREACRKDPSGIFFREDGKNLRTTGGTDWLAKVMSATAGPPAQGNYVALTSDTTAAAAGDCAAGSTTCTLTSEYSTLGLSRAQSTFAHTDGQSTYTLDHTWTCSSCSSTVVAKAAVFNASSSGTMIFEYKFGSSVTLNGSDQIEVTWTITLS